MITLLQIPASLLGVLIVAVVVAFSTTGLLLVRRYWSAASLKESNDVTDPVYSMIGVLYAVLLAFVVVVVWGQFTDAEQHTQMEANAAGDLFRDASAFPSNTRQELEQLLINYMSDVVNREWPAMTKGEPIELESPAFKQLWERYLTIQPQTNTQIAFYDESIRKLNELGSKRKQRILSSESELPPMLWVLLIGGGVISIIYTYMLGTKNTKVHLLLISLLSALLGFVLFLIFSLEHPYIGSLRVSPEAFEQILKTTMTH